MGNRTLALVALVLTIAHASPASAQPECTDLRADVEGASDDTARVLRLKSMVIGGCLGGSHDDEWTLVQTLDPRLTAAENRAEAAAAFASRLVQRAQAGAAHASTPEIANAFEAAALRLAELRRLVRQGRLDTALADEASWVPDGRLRVRAIANVETKDTFITEPCSGDGQACRSAVRDAMEWLRLVHAAGRVVANVTTRPSELKLAAELRRNDARWEAYFTQARSQFPLELAVNSLAYSRDKQEYCDGEGGFCRPPAHQWIVLHPAVALEYVEDSPSGNRVEPALVLELLGYNRWSWEGARMGTAFGGSVIAVASDRAGIDDLGYGFMFHYDHKWSLGITQRNDSTGVFLSYELWDTAETEVEELRDRFSGVRDRFEDVTD